MENNNQNLGNGDAAAHVPDGTAGRGEELVRPIQGSEVSDDFRDLGGKPVSPEVAAEIDRALGLVTVPLRMEAGMYKLYQAFAKSEGVNEMALMRTILSSINLSTGRLIAKQIREDKDGDRKQLWGMTQQELDDGAI